MKNKKGFTLIELLAVIVILAIIALIATPIVLNMINSARKKAAESSAYGFIDAIEYNNGFAQTEQPGYTEINGTDLDVTSSVFNNLKLKGKKPSSGTVTIVNGKVTSATNLCFNDYKVNYDGRVATVGDKCDGSSSSTPSTPVVQSGFQPIYFAYGDLEYDDNDDEIDNFPTTLTTRPTIDQTWFYAAMDGQGNKGLCINYYDSPNEGAEAHIECFQANNVEFEQQHLQRFCVRDNIVEGNIELEQIDNGYSCNIYDTAEILINNDGSVELGGASSMGNCSIDSDGYTTCSEPE